MELSEKQAHLKRRLDEIQLAWTRYFARKQRELHEIEEQIFSPIAVKDLPKTCPTCHAEWLDGQGDCPVCNFSPYELTGEH